MLKLLLALFISTAAAQTPPTWLVFPSLSACQTRSQQMCTAMGCDGVNTKYWWSCGTALNAGTAGATVVAAGSFGMRIDNGTLYGPTASNLVSGGTQGLTALEQSNLIPNAALAPLIIPPVVVTP